jgi:superfamily II helicase
VQVPEGYPRNCLLTHEYDHRSLGKRKRITQLSPPKKAMVEKEMAKGGNVIIVVNLAIGRTIVGQKAAERRTRSRIG